jgi:hypothetical protein
MERQILETTAGLLTAVACGDSGRSANTRSTLRRRPARRGAARADWLYRRDGLAYRRLLRGRCGAIQEAVRAARRHVFPAASV